MSNGHTERETRVLQLARDGLEFMRANDNNANFSLGGAWKTLELILEEFGETVTPPPWRETRTDDQGVAK